MLTEPDGYLKSKTWLIGERLTLADFSVGGVIPSAKAMDLSIAKYPEISRWYDKLSALPGWHSKMSTEWIFRSDTPHRGLDIRSPLSRNSYLPLTRPVPHCRWG